MTIFSMILDLVVAGLLAVTIAYAVLLSRRLGALRNDKQQLETLVQSLDASSIRANAGVAALKDAAEEIGRTLQQKIDQGQGLRNDLNYIVEVGGGIADRIETSIRSTREEAKRPAAAEPAAQPARRAVGDGMSPLRADEPGGAKESAQIAGFPSRAERLLRRALEARQ
ncbi:MAG: uncharacterized protein JWL84_6008 [Rhodospirillales bacterium]|jgi:hypothetical protein|nr:uncharacterized protein [Rhodospirillales bacterium]